MKAPTNKQIFAWLASATSRDERRANLQLICSDHDRSVATDGHRLHAWNGPLNPSTGTVYYDRKGDKHPEPGASYPDTSELWRQASVRRANGCIAGEVDRGQLLQAMELAVSNIDQHVGLPPGARLPHKPWPSVLISFQNDALTLQGICIEWVKAKSKHTKGAKSWCDWFHTNLLEGSLQQIPFKRDWSTPSPVDTWIALNARYMTQALARPIFHDHVTLIFTRNVDPLHLIHDPAEAVIMPINYRRT